MKTRRWKMEDGVWPARSVLECGSPLPLLTGDKHSAAPQSAGGPAHSKTWRTFAASLALLAIAPSVGAQNYSVDWYKISGGGGTSTNRPYALSGTIGQHDAGGPMTGGNYSLTGGFWALYAVQTSGAPLLTIFLTDTNTAIVAWPAPATGFTLQQNDNPGTTNWVAVTNVPVAVNGTNQVTISPPTGTRFYRLFHR